MFCAYFAIILKDQKLPRSYEFSQSKIIKFIVALIGLVISLGTFVVAFAKPAALSVSEGKIYQQLLGISFIVMFSIPFIVYYLQKIVKKN